jgi:hypothetical protein
MEMEMTTTREVRQLQPKSVRLTVSDWAAARYPAGPFTDPYPKQRAEKFGERVQPVKIRRGLPDDFPPIVAGQSTGWANRDEWCTRAEVAYATGYGDALVLAIMYSDLYTPSLPLPAWVHVALVRGFNLWTHRDAKTLEHALGLASPRVNLAEEQFWAENLGRIYLDIEDARTRGLSRYSNDEELFRVIAAHYGKSKTAVRTRYQVFKSRIRPDGQPNAAINPLPIMSLASG